MNSAKGCPNSECAAHTKKTLFKTTMSYCPECGTELAAVCKSKGCYTFLDDPSRKLCARCEAKHSDRVDGLKKAGAVTGSVVVAAIGPAIKLVSKIIKK